MEKERSPKADVLEIFSSVQGEGPFVGIKQIFIKFAACNVTCKFCDLERNLPPKEFSIEKLLSVVKQICVNSGDHHSMSLTGGEPLLYKNFLKDFLPRIKKEHKDLKVYLETNSTLVHSLKEIIDFVDIIAMDFKLPTSTGTKDYWKEHKEFLSVARKKNCFVKVVITNETRESDIKKAVNVICGIDKDLLLVLQPVWPVRNIERAKTSLLFDYLFLAERRLNNVRIMPQMHKVLRVR
ncbi:MAG: 7-carboxy-7-deazaguanine synthase QueE [Candidatus Omnitrophica bacterium]|nr:7-carboxy-7-deazaguanine synthase QueE [Candidatus Omnitrophota bacterium]